MDVVIRRSSAHELGHLADVELDGDRRYGGYDGVPPGFNDVTSASVLEQAQGLDRLWVAVDRGAGPQSESGIVGFALADLIDGVAHLAQVSVRLEYQGGGVGRRLIEAVADWARQERFESVTLCTFADVAWNRPLYEHLGFCVLAEEQWTPGLRAVFESDGDLGLDLGRRVVMRRDLRSERPPPR
jgi:GNAT superfamily N-acetyltransferase